MKTKIGGGLLLPIAGLFALSAFGQELTLFQDDSLRGGFTPSGPSAAARPPDTPAVVLKGIYRLGDTYHVSVQLGDAVHNVTWQPSQSSAPSLNGYQIQLVDSRNVTLGLPTGFNCQTSAPSGGTCLGRSQMSLTFAQTAPAFALPPNQGSNANRGNGGRSPGQRNDEWWNAQTSDGGAVPVPFGAAPTDPSDGAELPAVEAGFRGRGGAGRGNNGNAGNAGGRGGRGGFNGTTGGGFPGTDGGTDGGGAGARGGGRGGNGQ